MVSTVHDNDVWLMPSTTATTQLLMVKIDELLTKVQSLRNHSHLGFSGDIHNYTMNLVMSYYGKIDIALKSVKNLKLWIEGIYALECEEIVGHDVRLVQEKLDLIVRVILSAETSSKKLCTDPIVLQEYYVTPPPAKTFKLTCELAKDMKDYIGNHEGFDCKEKGCVYG